MMPYYEQDGITIYHGDCRAIIPKVDASVVITDPPYGTGGWRRTVVGAGGNPSGSLIREDWDDGLVDWIGQIRAEAVLTFWPAARTLYLLSAAKDAGLDKHRALYWRKPDPKPMPAGRVQWSVEPVWVLSRDGFVLYGGHDWVECSALHPERNAEHLGHPYQKPVRVMRWLVAKTQGGVILDPFMGVGSTLRAAKDLGRQAIGIELDERYCEIAAKRLAQGVLPLTA